MFFILLETNVDQNIRGDSQISHYFCINQTIQFNVAFWDYILMRIFSSIKKKKFDMKGMILFCVICAAIVLKKTNFNNVFRASILCINDNNAWNTFVQYLFSIWSHNKLLRRVLYHRVNVEQSYHFLFVSLLDLSFWSYQVERIIRVQILLDSPSTFLLLKTKRTECCVSGTPITRQPQYLILSTLPVHTTGDTLFTTIIELTNRFLMGILRMLTMTSVK